MPGCPAHAGIVPPDTPIESQSLAVAPQTGDVPKCRRPTAATSTPWYDKPSPTFVDAIALVRRHLWLASEGFSLSPGSSDTQQFPIALYHRMVDSLAYAA